MMARSSPLVLLVSISICIQLAHFASSSSLNDELDKSKEFYSSQQDYEYLGQTSSVEKDSTQDSNESRPNKNSSIIERYKKCGGKSYCAKRTQNYLKEPFYNTTNDWGNYLCFCDENCYNYGDCCIDKVISLEKPDVIKGHPKQHWGCIKINSVFGVLGLTSCDSDSELGRLCEKNGSTDFYPDIAVYSKSTEIVYANIYCALCHSVQPHDIVFSQHDILCRQNGSKLEGLHYKNLDWFAVKKHQKPKRVCHMDLSGFPEQSRICYQGLIDSCPSAGDDEMHACEAYTLPVSHSNTNYKNPHCALCHGERLKSLSCFTPFNIKNLGGASMTELMDFNWDFRICQWPKTLWDSTKRSCLPLNCDLDTCFVTKKSHHYVVESYLTLVALLVSIFFLLMHNLIYYLEPKRQKIPSRILKNLSWSLIFGHLFLLFVDSKVLVPLAVCKFIGISTQFFYLSSFFWMNVMSYDVWRTFSRVSLSRSSSSLFKKYNIYAWGGSLIIVLSTVFSDLTMFIPDNFRPHMGLRNICWFSHKLVLAIYFFFPVFILLLVNLYFFAKTVLWFQKQTTREFEKVNNEVSGRKEYHKLWLYIKLCVIMGLTWLFSVVSSLTHLQVIRYLFIIFNGLQGALIFILFDLKRTRFMQVVESLKSRTSWTSNTSDGKNVQTADTASSNSRNLHSLTLQKNKAYN